MKNTTLYLYSVIAILGLSDAVYLTYTRFLNIAPPCSLSILNGCETVARSPYSIAFGVPLSLFGMIFYGFALLLTIAYLYKRFEYFKELLLATSIAGALSSTYFVYLQAFIIKAFCIYCVFSAACSFMLLGLALYFFIKNNNTNIL